MKHTNLSLILFPLVIIPRGLSFSLKQSVDQGRRGCLKKLVTASSTVILISKPKPAISANLPVSNGGDLSQTGSIEKLVPIVAFQKSLLEANALLIKADSSSMSPYLLKQLSSVVGKITSEEKLFKRYFDEYSDPVSYKQKYMDQNAFLVYYTNGFDGPGRASIESGEVPKQTLQYGARNECWNAIEELNVEIKFALKDGSSSRDHILEPLTKAINSFDAYLSIAPKNDVEKAEGTLQ